MVMMVHLAIIKCLVIFHVLNNTETTNTEMCSFRPHTDDCENRGWLWDCSYLSLQTVPRNIPEKYRNTSLALDLSGNKFTTLSSETFSRVNIKLLPNIKALYLQYNNIRIIRKFAFGSLENLCVLTLYKCNLGKFSLANQSFANLTKLKVLHIHYNAFEHLGYPDIEISRILTLKSLTLGVFKGFLFSDHFRKLTQLEKVILFKEKSKFHLKKSTFVGLSNSPIYYLKLYFRNLVYCDVSEEIFCSFPVLKGVFIDFGGMCDLNVALLSLKCLQNRTMDYINADENKPRHPEREIFLNKQNCKYLFNTCTKNVTLSKNRISRISDNPLKTRMGQCMEYFDISMNRIEFIKPDIMVDFLTAYPRLRENDKLQ
ncbi:uncharacterized protein LOC133195103 [Saccostrea echinata]|uniref:uncharacterized protein LOC133195103 n=1 Tax=Saccostrea echinata TaxID=191078 RepID=UPI002A8236DC|nr:uncharacterized protein LOC133195103 [Saccostrea echinata]